MLFSRQLWALKQWLLTARSAHWHLMATSIQATASLHRWTAASLHTTGASSALVVADALVHALVAGALHQFVHAASTTTGVTLALVMSSQTSTNYRAILENITKNRVLIVFINHLKVSRCSNSEHIKQKNTKDVFFLPGLHATLGASEARSTGAAALVQWTIEALPSTFLPEVQVLAVGASTTWPTWLSSSSIKASW